MLKVVRYSFEHVDSLGLLLRNDDIVSDLIVFNSEDACNSGGGNRVVEVLVLIVPLDCKVVLATVLEGLVHRGEVLASAHRGDPGVGWLVDGSVVEGEADWVPTLLDLGVDVEGAVEVSVDTLEDVQVDVLEVGLECVVEDHLQVGVVGVVY